MPHHCRTGESDRPTQLGNHEAVLRMGFPARLLPVMAAKHLLNLMQRLMALVARLPLPEQNKALPAHATFDFGIPACALAKNLHFQASFISGLFPSHKDESSLLAGS